MNGLNDNVRQVYITEHLVQYFFTFTKKNVFFFQLQIYRIDYYIVSRLIVFVIYDVFVHMYTFYEMVYFSMFQFFECVKINLYIMINCFQMKENVSAPTT